MTPFGSEKAKESLQESMKRVEKSLTAAQKAARRLSAGRKPKKSEMFSKLAAASRAVAFLESAVTVLNGQGLEPTDLRVHLAYTDGTNAKLISLSDNAAEFFNRLDRLEDDNLLFLGLLGELRDREAGENVILRWIRPFVVTPLAAAALMALKDERGTEFLN